MDPVKKPWVSFCMSTYKRPVFLKHTLQSILAQTFSDFEVIVSDNDPERSAEIVVKTINDPRVLYFSNTDNLGMIKSFNKSIERSHADFIVMITDDDPVYPDLLETFYQLTKEFPGYGMYLGGCDWFCTHPDVAKLYKLKIGTNSCLSNEHELNYTRAFSSAEFLQSFFTLKCPYTTYCIQQDPYTLFSRSAGRHLLCFLQTYTFSHPSDREEIQSQDRQRRYRGSQDFLKR